MDIDGVSARSTTAAVPPGVLLALMDDLLQYDLATSPHVLARLLHELHGDLPTIREVAAQLTPSQRHGLRPLPSPLPLVPPIANAFAGLQLSSDDVEILLATALSLGDDLETLERFAERKAAEIMRTAAGEHLSIHAGRCRLRDPRLGIWLRETTAPTVQIAVHARLSTIARRAGDGVAADWHWARSSLRGVPATAAELTRIARELSEAGEADRALLLAAEAAAHAIGPDRDEARLVAGMAALGAGFAAEADDWLSGIFPDGAERYRLQALGGLLVSRAHLHGRVPELSPASLHPRSDLEEDWYSWTRAAAFGAVLCAERGDRRGLRGWLEALREGCARTGAEEQLRDPVVALCWLLTGEETSELRAGSGPFTGDILVAMRAALAGDVDEGLRMIAPGRGLDATVDPFVAGFENSPVVASYRAVTETLLLVWRGDLGHARRRLIEAASAMPITIPFDGLGVLLARRLDLAVHGRLTAFARSLLAAVPHGRQEDHLLDRSIEAHLAGDFAESARLHGLWRDRGAPTSTLDVLGFDEVAVAPAERSARRAPEPPEERMTRALLERAAALDARAGELEQIEADARSLRSPFARGRIEAALGRRLAVRGEPAAARAHLLTACSLFEEAGADAWATSIRRRLQKLGPVGGEGGHDELLDACRRAWEALLTARELEVAMLVVGGTRNREIAEALSVSVRTVEVHVGRLLGKFGLRTRGELIALAHRTGRHA